MPQPASFFPRRSGPILGTVPAVSKDIASTPGWLYGNVGLTRSAARQPLSRTSRLLENTGALVDTICVSPFDACALACCW